MASKTKRARNYFVKILDGMARGLFASLIIGLIITQVGEIFNLEWLINLGEIAQFMMGPAIGIGVAASVSASGLSMYASAVTGAVGAGTVVFTEGGINVAIGEPVGALIAALIGAEVARRISGKTPVDIVLVPAAAILSGGGAGILLAPVLVELTYLLGEMINAATALRPFSMGIAVSVIMGMLLTLPISSAALAISLGLEGLAAGAATVGCSAQMIGFAVTSFKANGPGGFFAQALGTSMLQIGNIVKNPYIWVPPTLSAAVLGPMSTILFRMTNSRIGAGMGTSGLVGQVATLEVMGGNAIPGIILLHFILPAIFSYIFYLILQSKKLIADSDLDIREG